MVALKFNQVSFSYGKSNFMDKMSFEVTKGEVVGLMGPNGSGKSTVLKLATGILTPQEGTVLAEGRPVSSYRGKERAKQLAYLPQVLDMQAPFRVGELVAMGEYTHKESRTFSVKEALGIVGLQGKTTTFLADLSGGERRRAYIAMTLVQGAKVLLLDEPLASLDPKYQVELIRLLKNIVQSKEISVLMSLHDIGMGTLLDRLLLVKEGVLIAAGNPAEVLTDKIVQNAYDLDNLNGIYPVRHQNVCDTVAVAGLT